jgi:hypothetical protein
MKRNHATREDVKMSNPSLAVPSAFQPSPGKNDERILDDDLMSHHAQREIQKFEKWKF